MSLKDKLEIGLKPDAPFRPDNLPDFQKNDADCAEGATPGESPEVEEARADCDDTPARKRRRSRAQPSEKAER
jgi:hypothetical protein